MQGASGSAEPAEKTVVARYVWLWGRWTLWVALALIIEETLRALIEQYSPPPPPFDHPLETLGFAFFPYVLMVGIGSAIAAAVGTAIAALFMRSQPERAFGARVSFGRGLGFALIVAGALGVFVALYEYTRFR